ncbi:MAG: hypothetical protein LIO71_09990 [Ruminococcus sp.]|nr:hypothetical protein [Ruminococcus sp.]MCD7800128.1 hypothetical protein [Ruminococcus sp.]
MNKILVEIFCPSVSKNYDFWIPKKMNVQKAILIIMEEIKSHEENDNLFTNPNDIMLLSKTDGCLNKSLTFENQGVKSGDTLVII